MALVLVFVFCLIAINSTGLTSITPIGAMGKLTQLTFGVLAPGNKAVNLMTAGITGEVASHAANLLQDIKPGYMLGAKPRQQAVGHVLGIFAGAVLSVPIFYLVFSAGCRPSRGSSRPSLSAPYRTRTPSKYPDAGGDRLEGRGRRAGRGNRRTSSRSARWAALAGILIGIVLELAADASPRTAFRSRRWPSAWASSFRSTPACRCSPARSCSGSSEKLFSEQGEPR